jgi:hypothetical protein
LVSPETAIRIRLAGSWLALLVGVLLAVWLRPILLLFAVAIVCMPLRHWDLASASGRALAVWAAWVGLVGVAALACCICGHATWGAIAAAGLLPWAFYAIRRRDGDLRPKGVVHIALLAVGVLLLVLLEAAIFLGLRDYVPGWGSNAWKTLLWAWFGAAIVVTLVQDCRIFFRPALCLKTTDNPTGPPAAG